MASTTSANGVAFHWFRKGLRVHDNPALAEAAASGKTVVPVFCIDPAFARTGKVGLVRYRFLLESLSDLDRSLRERGSRLLVLRGSPGEVLPPLFGMDGASSITWEHDTEPYAKARDAAIAAAAGDCGLRVGIHHSHTLHEVEALVAASKGKPPSTYRAFLGLMAKVGPPPPAIDAPDALPPLPEALLSAIAGAVGPEASGGGRFAVPGLEEMGYCPEEAASKPALFAGGESAGLERMARHLDDVEWIAAFEKPKTSPNALEPSTTVLSPYLKFGCVSARRFWHALQGAYDEAKARKLRVAQPPTSLHGQLLFREFFYFCSVATPNFGRMEGNPRCYQISWDWDEDLLAAWEEGRTGYPFIDAIMTQLRLEGWIHHLARHAVACFLTRGDLFQHWERGAEVFEKHLVDADWAINRANWQWLSASCFFHQYFRVYSPVAFGKKTDKSGAYIRKYLPQLKDFPDKFIYEPWKAPRAVQERANCIIGEDYPEPIVPDHTLTSKENMAKMKAAYDARKAGVAVPPAAMPPGASPEDGGVFDAAHAAPPAKTPRRA